MSKIFTPEAGRLFADLIDKYTNRESGTIDWTAMFSNEQDNIAKIGVEPWDRLKGYAYMTKAKYGVGVVSEKFKARSAQARATQAANQTKRRGRPPTPAAEPVVQRPSSRWAVNYCYNCGCPQTITRAAAKMEIPQ